jgi:hypothetical protein
MASHSAWRRNYTTEVCYTNLKFIKVYCYCTSGNFSKPASAGTNKDGQFRGMTGFVRLTLLRNVWQGLIKSVDIQGGPVFLESCLEKFHCIQHRYMLD